MSKKAVQVTPVLVDTLKKAKILVNRTDVSIEQNRVVEKETQQENTLPIMR